MALANIDQVLLQGIKPKRILDGELARLTVLTRSRKLKLVTLPEQTGFDSVKAKPYIVKITQDGFLISRLHRPAMI